MGFSDVKVPVFLLIVMFIFNELTSLSSYDRIRELSSIDLSNAHDSSSSLQSFDSWRKQTDSTRDTTRNHTAAICSVAKDEEAYIDEWVDYNLALGFDTIYVYDNSDDNDLKQWGERRGDRVQVLHYNGTTKQMEAYRACAEAIQSKHTWAAFFDVDEFLVLFKHSHVVDLLEEHLPNGGALSITWLFFSADENEAYSPEPVTKRFRRRIGNGDRHIKSIVKLSDMEMKTPGTPHYFFMKAGKTQFDTNGKSFTGPYNMDAPIDVAMLHHYHTKSFKEYMYKRCVRKRATVGPEVDQTHMCDEAKQKKRHAGTTYDDTAWKILKKNVPPYRIFA